MSAENVNEHSSPSWFVPPGDSDFLAFVALVFICLAIYGIFYLYAAFDRWAEHKSEGTPLAKTIPTMLTIALAYEIFPLGHFSILLPASAILIALMADWNHFRFGALTAGSEPPETGETTEQDVDPDTSQPEGTDTARETVGV